MRLACFLLLFVGLPVAAQTTVFPGLTGQDLREAIDQGYSPARTSGYGPARDELYAREQAEYGEVCGVYTQFCITLTPGADPSTDAFNQGVNAEHTWPQSFGAGDEPARSDLHNLFPSRATVNSARSNLPLMEVPDTQAVAWYRGAVSQGSIPTVDIDEWSERRGSAFEPREDHKGNAARAVLYFVSVWPERVTASGDAYLESMLPDLLAWNDLDPADERERDRNDWIAVRQGSENPFVLDPTLARRAYGSSPVAAEEEPSEASVRIGPNPARGEVTVRVPGPFEVVVRDALGRRVLSASGVSALRVDTRSLAAGVYAFTVDSRRGRTTRPITLQR